MPYARIESGKSRALEAAERACREDKEVVAQDFPCVEWANRYYKSICLHGMYSFSVIIQGDLNALEICNMKNIGRVVAKGFAVMVAVRRYHSDFADGPRTRLAFGVLAAPTTIRIYSYDTAIQFCKCMAP